VCVREREMCVCVFTCDNFDIPSTKHMASRMLLFPVPFLPVIALNDLSNPEITVRFAYDLNPSMITSFTLIFFSIF